MPTEPELVVVISDLPTARAANSTAVAPEFTFKYCPPVPEKDEGVLGKDKKSTLVVFIVAHAKLPPVIVRNWPLEPTDGDN